MIKIITTDDHPTIRDGLNNVLGHEKEIEIIGFAENGAELLTMLTKKKPDLVLIDINMPVMNGIDAIKVIKSRYPEIKLIVFSQYDEKRFVKRVLKEGANGYLLKSATATDILKAVRMVMGGGMFLSDELPNIFEDKPKARPNYLFAELTTREKEVLFHICDEKTTEEIAEILFISFNTVESHRSNILLKVGVKNTAGLVKWALENEVV